MAVIKTWNATALTGGTARSLDSLLQTHPSDSDFDLADGDRATVLTSADKLYIYRYDAASTDAESSPDRIRPDDFSTSGVWHLGESPFDIAGIGTVPATVLMRDGILGGTASHAPDAVNDINFAALLCMDSTNTSKMFNHQSLRKELDSAWQAGTAMGGLLNGSKAINTVYKWYALLKDADSSVDYGFLALADNIETYLPSGYSKYRYLGFRHTNSAGAWAGFTQNGDYINGWTASENVLSTGITTSHATVDHTVLIDTNHIELIEYGVRDATTTGSVYASDDGGINTSVFIGGSISDIVDTGINIWGSSNFQKNSLKPFNADREFRTNTGTLDLLYQAAKFKR